MDSIHGAGGRRGLGRWIDVARKGNDIVITDRGTPVDRIVAIDSTSVIDGLTAQTSG
jgi:antitoxin (DNA-binding transcriptional repressor) of toxin-antitoxin stability system